ncbi:Glucosamine-phosphate N-acetyltransferase-like protein [Mycoemilia scoparia]|uniref:Glucosamine 6-phosphate N-acetyltransferase n=1 Tax=Mycoemilia scoparia TaxID=417184 RepID=A0A9W8DNT9_9FUNG|nr:Glucosamine-phosphate N-acetyltransferase-like protein [Mycoemilia scoparia]
MVSTSHLFDPNLLGDDLKADLPQGYVIRPLSQDDFSKGYVDLLSTLTTVGDVTEESFNATFQAMRRSNIYYITVIEDTAAERVVASGSLICELKFIHSCGKVGHVEDVVVAKDQQGKKLGATIIKQLMVLSQNLECYKTILDCSEANAPFYKKCGMIEKGVQMAIYFDKDGSNGADKKTSTSESSKETADEVITKGINGVKL